MCKSEKMRWDILYCLEIMKIRRKEIKAHPLFQDAHHINRKKWRILQYSTFVLCFVDKNINIYFYVVFNEQWI